MCHLCHVFVQDCSYGVPWFVFEQNSFTGQVATLSQVKQDWWVDENLNDVITLLVVQTPARDVTVQ